LVKKIAGAHEVDASTIEALRAAEGGEAAATRAAAAALESLDAAGGPRSDSPDAMLIGRLARALYTGVHGEGSAARRVSFARALMFDVVRDKLTAPSFCSWGPNFWAQGEANSK
jgi:hypothetical protein